MEDIIIYKTVGIFSTQLMENPYCIKFNVEESIYTCWRVVNWKNERFLMTLLKKAWFGWSAQVLLQRAVARAIRSRLRLIAPKQKLISSIQAFSGKGECGKILLTFQCREDCSEQPAYFVQLLELYNLTPCLW